MRSISEHISTLLYDHDCVIIPEFGGFVSNLQGASIQSRMNVILPPRKIIGFNQHLKNNDGMLVHLIAQEYGLQYNDALKLVQKAVVEMNKQLLNGERLNFPKIGVIYQNKDKAIQFVSEGNVNFLKSSYGLPGIALLEINTEKTEEFAEVKETPVVPITKEKEESATKKKKRVWVAALAFGIVGLAAVMAGSQYANHVNLGALNGVTSLFVGETSPTSQSRYLPRFEEEDIQLEHAEVGNLIEDIERNHPEMVSVYYSFHENKVSPEGILIQLRETPIDQEITELASVDLSASNLKLYSVVAGAFSSSSNADKLVKQLKSKGFDASRIGKKGRLHLVAYGSFSNKASAKAALEEIKSSENPHAWIK